MSKVELGTNERGNLKLCPMVDCQVQIASNDMVAVTIDYVQRIEEFDTGHWEQLRTVLSAQQAFELGATLKKAARLILSAGSDSLN